MENQVILKKGQKVRVKDGSNASDFNTCEKCNIMSVYCSSNWENEEYEIEGTIKLITFDHDPCVYGAYLLKLRGVNVGYIYNTGLEVVKQEKIEEYTMEELTEKLGHSFKIKK